MAVASRFRCAVASLFLIAGASLADAADGEAAKLPVPDAAALKVANKQIDEKYGKPLRLTKNGIARSRFGSYLNRESLKEWSDPASDYAFRTWILSLPTLTTWDSLSYPAHARAIRQLEARFQVDGFELRVESARKILKSPKQAVAADVVSLVYEVVDQAIQRDRLDLAVELAGKASTVGKTAKAYGMKQGFEQLLSQTNQSQLEFVAVSKHIKALEMDESDATAAAAVGQYRCFHCANWPVGLQLLAKGDDKNLAAIAVAELAPPETSESQAAVAELWHKYSQTAADVSKEQAQRRSLFWYREAAISQADAVKKVELDKRIGELEAEIPLGAIPWGASALLSFEKSKWKNNDGAQTILDASDARPQGSSNGATMVAGRAGQGASVSGRVTINFRESSFDADVRSMCTWVNLRQWPDNDGFLVGDCTEIPQEFSSSSPEVIQKAGPHGCSLALSRTGASFRIGNSDDWIIARSRDAFKFSRDTWYHLTGTYDGKELKIYVNGHLHDRIPYTRGVQGLGTKTVMGFNPGSLENTFDGIVDEFAKYDRCLTAEEVDTMYRMGLRGSSFSK